MPQAQVKEVRKEVNKNHQTKFKKVSRNKK